MKIFQQLEAMTYLMLTFGSSILKNLNNLMEFLMRCPCVPNKEKGNQHDRVINKHDDI